ncbi:helix-turn-helix domain-containing protein [Pedobacter sp. 22163]|jgi:transcriptional regulator with XRE-family HTH domain|uniref:helix-turn-helix domain-containing protein n=1 Tax=Pedobacter sp. 22163 TaxID=3453883 RepID=UPI003F829CCF
MGIGIEIRKLRVQNHYSQEYVAFYLGITRNAYMKWEKDGVNLNLKQLSTLAELYEIEMIDFLIKVLRITGMSKQTV